MRKVFFCGILLFTFVFSIGIGYYYSSLWKKENISVMEENNTINRNIVTETVSSEEIVSYNASFALKKYYDKCGHSKINYSELPKELINLTEKELEDLYSTWRVEEFSKDNVVLAQNIDSICDEHYVLKLIEDNVEIYSVKNADDLELFKTTNISKQYLTTTDIEQLEKGIYVYGNGNLNSALEDFE